ncbi:uncharacterized protein ACA1_272650 [Acanthamoeba castellanii str. Neff]|uniref:DH domain-containing protein n=1 Tax=Acanthamoeba castellanii (strain ATCC 30010 / Neff) TaxID=1257118 RepID=L8HG58_ACACF|nr:uncharacterized protein ACA1_272650 [Acanthamoeba castellanii str. Neff]ELR24242.1 hypothetical protein ACA1_272650 [Acanthamoeba castellanii str. Neff]
MEPPSSTKGMVEQRRRRFEDVLAPSGSVTTVFPPFSLGRQSVRAGGGTAAFEVVVEVCHEYYCRAVADYAARAEGELSLRRGDVLQVLPPWPLPAPPRRTHPQSLLHFIIVIASIAIAIVLAVHFHFHFAVVVAEADAAATAAVDAQGRAAGPALRPRPLPAPPQRHSVVTSVLAQCQQLVSGCLELKEAAVAWTGAAVGVGFSAEEWQKKGDRLTKDAGELRKKAQELKKQSSANKYGTEEQLKKDMRLYLQHKKSLANFKNFTEDLTSLVERSVKTSIVTLARDSPPSAKEIDELDGHFAAVAESVKELVMTVQSWNLNVKNQRQLEKNSSPALSYGSLCAKAHAMGSQLPGLARTGDKHEFIRTAKDMLNTLDSISEYSATAGLVHEGVELKRLSHQLLSVTQADIGKQDSAVNAHIDKMRALIDASILVFVDSLSSALNASPATPSASSADLDSHWAQRSGPVSPRGALSGEVGITRDRSFSSPPTLTESTGAEREKQEKMRMNVINEILSTETVYCTQLKMVLADELLDSDRLLAKQFESWANLVDLSKEFLYGARIGHGPQWSWALTLGTLQG